MAEIYDRVDCLWTSRGDYYLGGDGDIMDTSFDPLRSVVQEIRTRSDSDQGDWAVFPTVGSDLRDFTGEPNSPTIAESIKTRLLAAYGRDGFINTRDIKIKYMPINRDTLLVRASLSVAPTAANGNSETLLLTMVYNYSDNNVYFMGV